MGGRHESRMLDHVYFGDDQRTLAGPHGCG
jgi:hypothetical protein